MKIVSWTCMNSLSWHKRLPNITLNATELTWWIFIMNSRFCQLWLPFWDLRWKFFKSIRNKFVFSPRVEKISCFRCLLDILSISENILPRILKKCARYTCRFKKNLVKLPLDRSMPINGYNNFLSSTFGLLFRDHRNNNYIRIKNLQHVMALQILTKLCIHGYIY